MRSVPVGGGCRRSSKRSKGGSNRSKSPGGSSTSTSTVSSNSCTTDILSHQLAHPPPPPPPPPPPTHFPFLGQNLQHLSDFGNLGLNFEALQIPSMASSAGESSILSSGITDHHQWKIPFFANLHQQNGLYSNFMAEEHHHQHQHQHQHQAQAADFSNYHRLSKPLMDTGFSSSTPHHQLGNINNNTMKIMEETQGIHNLSRNFLGIQPNDPFWNSTTSTTTTTTTTPGNTAWSTDQISDLL